MGFYDCRCMITGISLKITDATAVVLRRSGTEYRPLALGMHGTYDRQGGIDGIDEDRNTELVLRYFHERSREGRFTGLISGDEIEELLQRIERTHCDIADEILSADSTTLDGDLIVFALIAEPVWAAIATAGSERPVAERLERLFGPASAGADIYRDRLPELAAALTETAAVADFVAANGLRWAPPSEPAQRYPTDYGAQHYEEVVEFLDEARRDYRHHPTILAGLHAYEQLIEEE
ncbi:hypothetical protein AB0H76_14045 [Nocardia sp. NPDC050712]|uniref:hypothetical protein n=1 Tax=Nocardia sp. NPDC050712 TaxID=3155518 RepID=UPI0033D979CE